MREGWECRTGTIALNICKSIADFIFYKHVTGCCTPQQFKQICSPRSSPSAALARRRVSLPAAKFHAIQCFLFFILGCSSCTCLYGAFVAVPTSISRYPLSIFYPLPSLPRSLPPLFSFMRAPSGTALSFWQHFRREFSLFLCEPLALSAFCSFFLRSAFSYLFMVSTCQSALCLLD